MELVGHSTWDRAGQVTVRGIELVRSQYVGWRWSGHSTWDGVGR